MTTTRRLLGCVALVIGCIPEFSRAQQPSASRPGYDPERYDENWSFLRDPALRTDFFDPIKFIPLNRGGSAYLTLGGELRENFQDTRNMEFGLPSPMHTANDFHRIFLFADVHVGPHFRTFVDLVNGEVVGAMANPSPLQKDPLDILQAFADVIVPAGNHGDFTLRFGRHEMTFGSARLISFRDTPNVRLEFDGVRTFWTDGKGKRVDALLARPVKPRLGVFNDVRDSTQLLWGVYATSPIAPINGLSLDLYYLGFDNRNAIFAQGAGRERRHTIGAHVFGERSGFDWHEARAFRRGDQPDNDYGFDWDLEGAVQFGSFATSQIRAWMISSDWGYTVSAWRFSPRLGLKLDALSGDGNPQDNRLGTFNALYPALQYYSQPGLFAPSNLLNFQPNITVDPRKGLSVNVAWSSLHRESKADAFYATPPLAPLPGTATGKRLIGEEASVNVAWQATEHMTVLGTYAGFAPGASVRQVGGRSGHWFLALAQFKV